MALAAAQVIDAIAARIAALPAYAGKVHTSRAWPLAEGDLPAWRVTAEDEEAVGAMLGDHTYEHKLQIEARGYCRAVADLDDVMHAMAVAALPVIFAAPVPYALDLVGINRDTAVEGEAAVGVITLRMQALYYVRPTAPETILSS